MNISQEGIALIKKFEGCELEAYRCSADILTIGFGHTSGVAEGQTCTSEEAESILVKDLEEFEGYVNNLVEQDLDQNQFDALVAWTFNLGPSNLKESTLLKKLNAGEFNLAPHEIKRWNRAGGEVLDGLIRRRKAEALLFEGKAWENV